MEKGPSAWWDQSWNPTAGCWPVDSDCEAATRRSKPERSTAAGAKREVRLLYDGIADLIDGRWEFNGRTTRLPPGHPGWTLPLVYPGAYRPVLGPGKPSLIFVGDMSDVFFRQPPWVINKVVNNIVASPHIGLLLTRRPGRMRAYDIQGRRRWSSASLTVRAIFSVGDRAGQKPSAVWTLDRFQGRGYARRGSGRDRPTERSFTVPEPDPSRFHL